jgi:hypothetical protein
VAERTSIGFSHTSQLGRTEIGSVRNRKGLKDTPRKPLNYATDEEHLERLGEEGDEHSCRHEDETSDHGLLVADPFGNVAVDDES